MDLIQSSPFIKQEHAPALTGALTGHPSGLLVGSAESEAGISSVGVGGSPCEQRRADFIGQQSVIPVENCRELRVYDEQVWGNAPVEVSAHGLLVLVVGVQGTGKTSLIKALMKDSRAFPPHTATTVVSVQADPIAFCRAVGVRCE